MDINEVNPRDIADDSAQASSSKITSNKSDGMPEENVAKPLDRTENASIHFKNIKKCSSTPTVIKQELIEIDSSSEDEVEISFGSKDLNKFELEGPLKIYISVETLKTSTTRILLQLGGLNPYTGETIHVAFAPTDSLAEKSPAFLSKLHLIVQEKRKRKKVKKQEYLVLKDEKEIKASTQLEGMSCLEWFISQAKSKHEHVNKSICLVFYSIFEHQTLTMLARGLNYKEWMGTQNNVTFLDKINQSVESVFVYEHFNKDQPLENISTALNFEEGEYSALKAAQYLRQLIQKQKLTWEKVNTTREELS